MILVSLHTGCHGHKGHAICEWLWGSSRHRAKWCAEVWIQVLPWNTMDMRTDERYKIGHQPCLAFVGLSLACEQEGSWLLGQLASLILLIRLCVGLQIYLCVFTMQSVNHYRCSIDSMLKVIAIISQNMISQDKVNWRMFHCNSTYFSWVISSFEWPTQSWPTINSTYSS